jgi:hypothetical protein
VPLTAAEICNIALARVGQRQTIAALSETSAPGRLCNTLYPNARDSLLMSVPWSFATKRQTLAELVTDERDGWEYVYALPTDCLATRYLYPGLRNPTEKQKEPFAIEFDATESKRVLLTDCEDAILVYTASPGDVTANFPPLFCDALAWALAVDLALSLAVKPQVGLAMRQGYELALLKASAAELNQAQADTPPESEIITGRS